MAKVITFSRTFPSYHPEAGRKTLFVEKILNDLGIDYKHASYWHLLKQLNPLLPDSVIQHFIISLIDTTEKKAHTIRGGSRFRVGDYFSPRAWISRPYFPNFYDGKKIPSQIIFAPDTEVKKTWVLEITPQDGIIMPAASCTTHIEMIAQNDGLKLGDFTYWFKNFKEPGIYQIICWNQKINY